MTTDTQPTAETSNAIPTILDIPLDNLVPNPSNLRRHLGDTRRLARSIAEVGIVVPLVVSPNDDGTYLVVAGHRRLTAAGEAGLASAPCVVRTLTEAEQCTVMLTENDGEHRQPLNPVEEAAGYLRLVGLGQSTRALAAAVGRTPKHVKSRLALLELPAEAQRAVERGDLSVTDTEALAAIKDDAELMTEVLALPDWQRRDLPSVIERRLASREQETAYAEAVAAADARGLRVLDNDDASKARRLSALGLDPKAHRGEPCHAVVIERGWRKATTEPMCTDPRRHTAKVAESRRSELQVQPSAVAGRDPEDTERRRERKRVASRRAEFLASLIARRSMPRSELTAMCLHAVIDEAGQNPKARAGAILGIEPAATQWGGKDWTTPLTELAERSAADLLRVAAAIAAGCAEERIHGYGSYGGPTAEYLAWLVALGYEPDPYEQAELDAAAHHTSAPDSEPAA
jgi:ParB/RepB/Spo0J family partition protein